MNIDEIAQMSWELDSTWLWWSKGGSSQEGNYFKKRIQEVGGKSGRVVPEKPEGKEFQGGSGE